MNYIILVLEFIVLITSIGLFIAKSEMTPNGPRVDINWNIALFVTVILMIGINIRFICYGAYCFFTCGDESAEVSDAKQAVAIYRRAKAGKSLKAGIMGYENVNLNNLNQDDEETEFLGVTDPTEIKKIAEQNTKALLQQNIADRQAVSKERFQARTGEFQKALKGRPIPKEVEFAPHTIQAGGGVPNKGAAAAQASKGPQGGYVLGPPVKGQQVGPIQTVMGTGPGGAFVTKEDNTWGKLGFGKFQKRASSVAPAAAQQAADEAYPPLPSLPVDEGPIPGPLPPLPPN